MCDKRNMPPAGLVAKHSPKITQLWEHYNVIEAAKNAVDLLSKPSIVYPSAAKLYSPQDSIGDYFRDELKKGRFLKFREKFLEDLYSKKGELGSVRQLKAKPADVNNFNTTFGIKYDSKTTIKDSLIPKRTLQEINNEIKKSHNLYVLSHKHYFPGEKINRKYIESFNPRATFGLSTDRKGRDIVKNCLTQTNDIVLLSQGQKNQLVKYGIVGRASNNIARTDYNRIFGIPPQEKLTDVQTIFDKKSPEERNTDLAQAVGQAYRLRKYIYLNPLVDVFDIKTALKEFDIDHTGYITFQNLLEVSHKEKLPVNNIRLKLALKHFQMLKIIHNTECVYIDDFINLISGKHSFPENTALPRTQSLAEDFQDTTYNDMCKNVWYKPSAHRAEKLLITKKPYADTAKELVSNSVYVRYDLTPVDFEMQRSKEELRSLCDTIFANNFDEIFRAAKAKYKVQNDALTINQILNASEQMLQHKEIKTFSRI